jgi:monosaccharide-transporting ATPase
LADPSTDNLLLEMRGISKRFPGVQALADVDFRARRGEVHALMGENGAGKSTLIKVLTGVYPRDGGEVLLDGRPFLVRSPKEAQEGGVSTVYQEINLIPHLSVAENICLGRQPSRFGRVHWRGINQRAEDAIKRLGLTIDVTQPLSSCSIAIQQMVAIARALDISAKLLILDEPTSSLDMHEVERLFEVIRKLKSQDLGIVFITHFLDQVYQIADRITVLRNGRLVGEFETAKLPRVELVARMLGKEVAEVEEPEAARAAAPAARRREAAFLQVRGLGKKGAVEPLDIDVSAGEVLGLAGLLGSGRTETAKLLFGIERADSGRILLDGRRVAITNPRRAISRRFGFCPEDRQGEGLIPELSVRENIILAIQGNRGWARPLSRSKQLAIAESFIRALDIATPGPEQAAKNLSGGNQQKVILARWLASEPRFLILDEPTRGIDVGAKAEVEMLIVSLCREGVAILFISSELEEVVRRSHRVIVLRDRAKIAELVGDQITEQSIMHTIASHD